MCKKMAVLFHLSAQCDDGSVRLTGGPNIFEGRVELCVDGSWGQVCAMPWISLNAEVVCRQLGHSTITRK
jgi:deleted-in-malignant-brain-tumors protein 1